MTGVGGNVGLSIVQTIRDIDPGAWVLGCDARDRHAGSIVSDEFIQAPKAESAVYETWLDTVCREHHISHIIPATDHELLRIHASAALGRMPSRIITPNRLAVKVSRDKYALSHFLKERGIVVPWAKLPAEASALDVPFILKPRRGSGGRGVRTIATFEDFKSIDILDETFFIQELLRPANREVTCGVFRTKCGETRVIQLLRTLAEGRTMLAQIISDPEIQELCEQVAAALELRGSVNVQLIATAEGPRIFEINGRFSSTVHLRSRLGYQDVLWSLDDADGRTPSAYSPAPPGTVVYWTPSVSVLRPWELSHSRIAISEGGPTL